MAYVFDHQSTACHAERPVGFFAPLMRRLSAGLAWPGAVLRHRRLLNDMARMSDHELRDIGLRATDLNDATAVPFGKDPSPFLQARRGDRRTAAGCDHPHGAVRSCHAGRATPEFTLFQ